MADHNLHARLVATLRPKMTAVEAKLVVDRLVDEVHAYAVDYAAEQMQAQADLVAQMIESAQDCLEIMSAPQDVSGGEDHDPLPVPITAPQPPVPAGRHADDLRDVQS